MLDQIIIYFQSIDPILARGETNTNLGQSFAAKVP